MHVNTSALQNDKPLQTFRVYSKYYPKKVILARGHGDEDAIKKACEIHKPLATRPALVAVPC